MPAAKTKSSSVIKHLYTAGGKRFGSGSTDYLGVSHQIPSNGLNLEARTNSNLSNKFIGSMKSNSIGMTFNSISGREMIEICLEVHDKVGIVRNIIDLVSDFTCEGIDIIHPSKAQKSFWDTWMRKAKISDAAYKLINTILKAGTCVLHRRTSSLNKKQERDMKTAKAAFEDQRVVKRTIPIGYTVYNPLKYNINSVEDDGTPVITIMDLLNLKGSQKTLNSDPANFIATYRKDDWEKYAKPFHFAALDDLCFENKMQRMDNAAMDGIINAIRIWKIGGELKDGTPILPTTTATGKLAAILENDTGGGITDVIWDPFIDLTVEYPPVDKILGSDKYKHVRQKILEDFGIAQVLIDGTGQGSYSNQYLSVRSLLEKVEYLRGILMRWIEREVTYISKSLDLRKRPKIEIRNSELSDENARIALLTQLYDRGIISKTQMLQNVNHDWEIERERIKIEKKEAENDQELNKKGPFDTPNKDNNTKNKTNEEPPGKPGGDGRPPNDPADHPQQRRRQTKPQGASRIIFDLQDRALIAMEIIDELIDANFFEENGVNNIKELTKDKKKELEAHKFTILANINIDEVSKEMITPKIDIIAKMEVEAPEKLDRCVDQVFNRLMSDYRKKNGEPSTKKRRELRSRAWAICRSQLNL